MHDDITLNSSILVVDDSLFILKVIQDMLQDRYTVRLAASAEAAGKMLEESVPDIVLLDLEMPRKDGYEFLGELKRNPDWHDIPVIFLTGMNDRKKEEKALQMGAVDYILKPISNGVLRKRIQMHLELTAYQKKLQNLVDLKTRQLLKTQDMILDILANVTSYRDTDTGAHLIRTTNYSKLIVERLLKAEHPDCAITPEYAHDIIKCAKLHDIGKIAVPDVILQGDRRLTQEEFEQIQKHTTFGAQMIDKTISGMGDDASFLLTAREVVLHHHEWWNGLGYPMQLKGKEIPLSARVMAIADVYDALISKRSYKEPFTHELAIGVLNSEIGTHFDPVMMDIIKDLFPQFKEIAETFQGY